MSISAAVSMGQSATDGAPVYGIILRRASEATGLVDVGQRVRVGATGEAARVIRVGKVVVLKSRRPALAVAVAMVEHGTCAYCHGRYEIVDTNRRTVCPACDATPLTGSAAEGDAGDHVAGIGD